MPDRTTLVFANLFSAAGAPQLLENPLTQDLELAHAPDDSRLLIALGELSGSTRPLTPHRITRLERLALLWLGDDEWIAIPIGSPAVTLEEALVQQFAANATLELIPDGCFEVNLNPAGTQQLVEARSTGLNGYDAPLPAPLSQRFCVRPWTSAIAYDLVLRREDMRILNSRISTQH